MFESWAWKVFFWPASLLYGAAARLRARAYAQGWLETVRLPAPVFCVGGLTVGGAGKTPGVIWLCRFLRQRGKRPAVITRGYGRKSRATAAVAGPDADAREVGDEPALLARRLPGVPVLVDADRALAGRMALEEHGADCLVMDDGYQHFRLHRDFNLLCLDAGEARGFFQFGGGLLLPAGRLREPLPGVGRAAAVALTKADQLAPQELAELKAAVSRLCPDAPAAAARYSLSFYENPGGEPFPADSLRGKRLLAMTGLARPDSFEESLRRMGADVAARRFPDHHFFTDGERAAALEKARRDGRTLAVTEKDWVRLPADFPCLVARLDWDVEGGAEPWTKKIVSVIS